MSTETELTEEQLRIHIAERCGWENILILASGWPVGMRPGNRDGFAIAIPNYTQDLNAMHGAEKAMTREQTYRYNELLTDSKARPKDAEAYAERWTWHASALQRARAFHFVTQDL